jgi:hypothetical protein
VVAADVVELDAVVVEVVLESIRRISCGHNLRTKPNQCLILLCF